MRLPNAGTDRLVAKPYDERAPSGGISDLRAEKQFGFQHAVGLTVVLDAFNVLNDAPVLTFRTISGPRHNEIISILNPRVFRAGLRLEF